MGFGSWQIQHNVVTKRCPIWQSCGVKVVFDHDLLCSWSGLKCSALISIPSRCNEEDRSRASSCRSRVCVWSDLNNPSQTQSGRRLHRFRTVAEFLKIFAWYSNGGKKCGSQVLETLNTRIRAQEGDQEAAEAELGQTEERLRM